MNTTEQINNEIAKFEAEIAALKQQKEASAKLNAKLEKIYKSSGYSSPQELVRALMSTYSITPTQLNASKTSTRRRITAELRDTIKTEHKNGKSKRKLYMDHKTSFATVSRIIEGKYDHL